MSNIFGDRTVRIAVVFQGNANDAKAWSGVPAGLISGLEASGVEPVPVDARAPGSTAISRVLRMGWIARTTNPVFAATGGARARMTLRRGGCDGAVAIGSGYSLRSQVPTATFDDMTVAQALAQPGSVYEDLRESTARRWLARQKRGYQASRACCVPSDWAAHSIAEDYGIDPAKIHVVGLGRNAPRQVVERDWQLPRFLFVGMDWERKRGAAVIEAFSHVVERHPGATLDIVGQHPPIDVPGVTGHGVLSLASKEGREHRAALLSQATCQVLPSTFEPFGIAYIDAAASGLPSIGTTNGGARTAIGDGGLLVDPHDEDGLLEAMLAMCDPDTAARSGDRAFAHSAGFTWQAVAERIVAALDIDVRLNRD